MKEAKDLSNLTGIYRAKVVDNNDPSRSAKVKVWIPDIMINIPETEGVWAMPANNAIGGRNEEGGRSASFGGQCLIPPLGTYCFIFFECGNPSRPYYFGSLDLSGSQRALPECRVGDSPSNKWVLLKSPDGRCVTISDDPSDARVEITGKKRKLIDPPDGDMQSVYEIDTNQTTILLDERSGKEKLLIRSYKGDFINFDIENERLEIRVRNNIDIVCAGNCNIMSSGDMNLSSQGTLSLNAREITLQSGTSINLQASIDLDISIWGNINLQSMGITNLQSSGAINLDATILNELSGASTPSSFSIESPEIIYPVGKRDD